MDNPIEEAVVCAATITSMLRWPPTGIEMDKIITYFLWFILYSFIGWLYETIICSIGQRHFVNRGFLNGPYCPIYGTGALLMILILGHLTNPVALFLLGAIVACVLEYLTSYGMEKLFHARWWDYSKRLLNINGRVCLLGAVVFGLFSVLLILMIHPVICGWVDAVPILYRRVLMVAIFAGFIVDTVSSVSGMVDFQKKLEEHAATLEKRKAITIGRLKDSSAYETIKNRRNILSEKLTRQQLRMIEAFPKLKLHRHNDLLVELRKNISQNEINVKATAISICLKEFSLNPPAMMTKLFSEKFHKIKSLYLAQFITKHIIEAELSD